LLGNPFDVRSIPMAERIVHLHEPAQFVHVAPEVSTEGRYMSRASPSTCAA
jgi:hypothetical protein